ncbi:MAG: 4Fe-4S binding protein [Candidatus Ranarchaeia archaeon]
MEPNISIELCGLKLKNPFILTAGPYTRSGTLMKKAVEHGAGATVCKTVAVKEAVDPHPNMVKVGPNMLINAEKWTELPKEQWYNTELAIAKEADAPVIGCCGHAPDSVRQVAPELAKAGVDIIEVVSYNADHAVGMVKVAKEYTDLPVLCKVSANWPNLLEVIEKVKKAGANGITAIDSLGPVLAIDIETGMPMLASANGEGWLTGSPLRPLAVRIVAKIRQKFPDIDIVGTGGVMMGRDAVEMLMAGATAVGVCTGLIMKGYTIFKQLSDYLIKFMSRKNYRAITDFRSMVVPHLPPTEDLNWRYPCIDHDVCTHCQQCIKHCPYGALSLDADNKVVLNQSICYGCGYCYSICPVHCITMKRQ